MKKESKGTMLLISMFSGSYPEEHIGHEIINLFRTDDNKRYVYVPRNGFVDPRRWNVEKVLMLLNHGSGKYEVMGRAEGLANISLQSQKDVLDSLVYNGKSLADIMTAADQSFGDEKITFEATHCMQPAKPIFVETAGALSREENTIVLERDSDDGRNRAFYMRQRRYFEPNDNLYKQLDQLFVSDKYKWHDFPTVDEYMLQEEAGNSSFTFRGGRTDGHGGSSHNEKLFNRSLKEFMNIIKMDQRR